jgi:uncharacterized membrane protein
MKRKYVNIFWVLLGLIIVLNELVIGKIEFKAISQLELNTWLLVGVWLFVVVRNIISFYFKQTNEN